MLGAKYEMGGGSCPWMGVGDRNGFIHPTTLWLVHQQDGGQEIYSGAVNKDGQGNRGKDRQESTGE